MANLRLNMAYDGSAFLGWQKTKMGPSVEEALENVLEQVLQHPVALQAASRTDAGVHADGQVVNFYTTKALPDLNRFRYSLNCLLPSTIAVWEVAHVSDSFHPTLDVVEKEYHYHVCYHLIMHPLERHTTWHHPYQLDVHTMQHALSFFVGQHDFSALCNQKKNASYSDKIRTICSLVIQEPQPGYLTFIVRGNHFLYKMVRNIVGCLIDVGKGKIDPATIPAILTSGDRRLAGVTAPAHGLRLHRVYY